MKDERTLKLERFIEDQTGQAAEVSDLEHLPGGFSYGTWRLNARWYERGEWFESPLILRIAPRGGVLEPYDASVEFRILKALEATDFPAPRAHWVDATGDVLGTSFYLMEFVEGDVPLPWDETIPEPLRAEMHQQFTDALGLLHTIDWEGLGLDLLGVPDDRSDPAALELDRCEETLERISLRPYPMLHELIAHLRARRPRSPRLSLVHDDYRMGNFIWRDGKIQAFIDWERAFIGDPMADIAFSRLPLAGWCSVQGEMSSRYTAGSGIEVDEARVEYYVLLEQLKATIVGLTALPAFAEGRTSDLRLVQIGRGAFAGTFALAEQIGLGQ
ncbi:MAG: phosphotransferase family protein [Pseudomonadales bacterium]|jgi:aminoglycoside phosphotransferase (APT) family kinase protein|nr:phosphotransferase family protein [Pseudomonadales bacterium]MDP6829234.1 phosphotransferase family protein [Pseudomonadales bacterium]MDP6972631.1 phosphotransferase family protein [Pseudomonadales bacterium]